MPKLEEALIDKLISHPDVRDKARALLRAVHSRTGPGTGYDIGEGKTGIPAICAFIASKSAGYADVTEDIAQKASCLAPKTFASTFRTIKTALNAPKKTPSSSPSKSMDENGPTAYAKLIGEYKIGQPLRVESWMKDAQAALVALPQFQRKFSSRITESGAEVRIAVFVWVCKAIKLSSVRNNYMSLVDKFGVSLKTFTSLIGMMEDECVDLRESIDLEIKEMRKKKAEGKTASKTSTSTPRSTPSHSRSASPTKSALRNASLTPSLTSSLKRKVSFSVSVSTASEDDDDAPPETPSKRPRRTSSTTSRTSASILRELPVRRAATSTSSSEEGIEMRSDDLSPRRRLNIASEPIAGPSTPRRGRNAPNKIFPTHAYRTPPSARRIQALSLLSADDDDEEMMVEEATMVVDAEEDEEAEEEKDEDLLPLSRRFYPVFLDRVQWAERAPRLARDRAAAEKRTKILVERWGYPFEALGQAT